MSQTSEAFEALEDLVKRLNARKISAADAVKEANRYAKKAERPRWSLYWVRKTGDEYLTISGLPDGGRVPFQAIKGCIFRWGTIALSTLRRHWRPV